MPTEQNIPPMPTGAPLRDTRPRRFRNDTVKSKSNSIEENCDAFKKGCWSMIPPLDEGLEKKGHC